MGLPTVSESQLQRLSGSGVATATGDRTIGGGHTIYLRATWTNKRFTGQLCWLYRGGPAGPAAGKKGARGVKWSYFKLPQ